jgi:hypothetical protein
MKKLFAGTAIACAFFAFTAIYYLRDFGDCGFSACEIPQEKINLNQIIKAYSSNEPFIPRDGGFVTTPDFIIHTKGQVVKDELHHSVYDGVYYFDILSREGGLTLHSLAIELRHGSEVGFIVGGKRFMLRRSAGGLVTDKNINFTIQKDANF